MNQKIQIWHGLTGKQNFGALLTHMLLFELDVLNWIKHPGLIQPWRKICAVAMLLKRKAIRTRNPKDWANYRLLRNRIRNKVKTTEASYYHDSFIQSEGNAGRTWRTIINLMSRGQNNQIVKEVKVNDISICNSNEISNAFNEYFSTIGPGPAREIPLTSDEESIYLNNTPENCNKFCFRPTTTSVVSTYLNRLSKTKATGLDYISARLIR